MISICRTRALLSLETVGVVLTIGVVVGTGFASAAHADRAGTPARTPEWEALLGSQTTNDAGDQLACCDSVFNGVAPLDHVDPPIVVPRNSVWKYLATAVGIDASWVEPGFDDSMWATGAGILGYGESYVDTEIPYGPDPSNKYRTTYFRTEFTITDLRSHLMLAMAVNFDDGFICYLNGQEITRQSMPMGPVAYETFADSHEAGRYEEVNLNAFLSLLRVGSNQLAVEVHQMNEHSPDLVFDMEVFTSAIPGVLTRGPYLQVGTPSSMTVRWRTEEVTDSQVAWGPNPGMLTHAVGDGALTTEHELVVSGLAPNTRYYYSVGTTGGIIAGGDPLHSFRTSPPVGSGGPTRVWVIGDSGEANQNARDVRDAYLGYTGAVETDVWLMLGDNAYGDGKDSEYQDAVFDMYPTILRDTVLWPTRGNHDKLRSGPNNDYYDIFTMPMVGQAGGIASGSEAYYSFDHANVHFVCLDSQESDRSWTGPMLNWLAQDLISTNQDWVIAYFHHPPYSKGSHDSDDSDDSDGRLFEVREKILPLLEAVGVDLVLTGHSHSYERSFLIDGHYGDSDSLRSSMILNPGDGRPGSDGAYKKPTLGTGSHEGAVYAVAGSSSKTSGGSLDHPVMVVSLDVLGSLVLDIEGDQLDAVFIDDTGAVRDSFRIKKGVDTGVEVAGAHDPTRLQLLPNDPNPFGAQTMLRYVLPRAGSVTLALYDIQGRRVRTLLDDERAPGEHSMAWDGRDARGRPVAPGVYFGVLSFGDEVRTRKVIRVR